MPKELDLQNAEDIKVVKESLAKALKERIEAEEAILRELREKELKKAELAKASPPGRAEQVEALKEKGMPAEKAFKIAWASYKQKHGEKTKKNAFQGYGPTAPGLQNAPGGMAMSEDYIDKKNEGDPKKRLKDLSESKGVVPDDKKSKEVSADGSGGMKKDEFVGKAAAPPPVPADAGAKGGMKLPPGMTPVKATGKVSGGKLPGMIPGKAKPPPVPGGKYGSMLPAQKAEMSATEPVEKAGSMIPGRPGWKSPSGGQKTITMTSMTGLPTSPGAAAAKPPAMGAGVPHPQTSSVKKSDKKSEKSIAEEQHQRRVDKELDERVKSLPRTVASGGKNDLVKKSEDFNKEFGGCPLCQKTEHEGDCK